MSRLGDTLNILQISTYDHAGGAEGVAYSLFEAYRQRGHRSYLAVGWKRGQDPDVFQMKPRANGRWRDWWLRPEWRTEGSGARARARLAALGDPRRWLERQLGVEDFHFPATATAPLLPPHSPHILHAHNLHGGYFDLRMLPRLSAQRPLFLSLHDAWLLAGHCAHSLDCDRWLHGCGRCPDIARPIAIKRDASAYNWRRKRDIYARSKLYVATPCRWLMDKVERSMLMPGIVEARIIPYGIDLTLFHPGDKQKARATLGLPQDAHIVLFVGRATRSSPWKDYDLMEKVVERLAVNASNAKTVFVFLGEEHAPQKLGSVLMLFKGFEKQAADVARFFQAADVYLHAAKADTFPNVVLEAMACGLPVVATAVGGIPEQVEDGKTGLLAPTGDVEAMTACVHRLLTDPALRRRLGMNAACSARERFDRERMVNDYLDWYYQTLANQRRRPGRSFVAAH
ncbi:MAG: glycosyltransferase [Chloroflexi bacterium]|nr:glycosyltransferase [Chloroflexota bacterium]